MIVRRSVTDTDSRNTSEAASEKTQESEEKELLPPFAPLDTFTEAASGFAESPYFRGSLDLWAFAQRPSFSLDPFSRKQSILPSPSERSSLSVFFNDAPSPSPRTSIQPPAPPVAGKRASVADAQAPRKRPSFAISAILQEEDEVRAS